jgi:hypothetical protein
MEKNNKKLREFLIFVGLLCFIVPLVSFAQIKNPLASTDVQALISKIVGYVVQVGAVIAVVAFIYAGFLFVKAKGNPKGLEEAKTVVFYTIIGVAILLGANLIAQIVVGTIKSIGG